jgi:NADH:ubiquinone oxidoreductase subunit 5 (subunit L)/multisubunit Na+/H+ antiporter MnhA subunit
MAEDPHKQRFFSYLSMFTFFMLILVAGTRTGMNKPSMIVGLLDRRLNEWGLTQSSTVLLVGIVVTGIYLQMWLIAHATEHHQRCWSCNRCYHMNLGSKHAHQTSIYVSFARTLSRTGCKMEKAILHTLIFAAA